MPSPPLVRPGSGPLAGSIVAMLAALASMAWLWGFTVDDALITCRMAANLAHGFGYRFNVSGPVVDAVTPLGFAQLLAPFAAAGPEPALLAAKWLGALSWLLAAGLLGHQTFAIAGPQHGTLLLLLLGATSPLSAWAVSGMETGVVTALAVLALGPGISADLAAGMAAAWRPELAPWCACVRLGLRLASGTSLPKACLSPAIVVGSVVLVATLRFWIFGRAAPLALFAKPSDLAHGLSYAAHAFVQTGLPLLCIAPLTLRRGAPRARAITLAAAVHFGALVLAGGDWMTLYRLAVPVLPSFVLGAAELSRSAPRWATLSRVALAFAVCLHLGLSVGPVARRVGDHRARLIEQARGPLEGARSIAALDVGWVGAATNESVLDLAGVTDETVAMLAGGHTSKRIDDSLLRARDVDALVLLSARAGLTGYDREVEHRVALLPSVADFREVARIPLGGTSQHYVILRKQK